MNQNTPTFRGKWPRVLLVAFVVQCLFPPWVLTFQAAGASQTLRPAGYYPVWSPPQVGRSLRAGVKLDLGRFGLQLLALGGMAGIVAVTRTKEEDPVLTPNWQDLDQQISRQIIKLWTAATHQNGYIKDDWNHLTSLLSQRGIQR
jgi:hypothetical protein